MSCIAITVLGCYLVGRLVSCVWFVGSLTRSCALDLNAPKDLRARLAQAGSIVRLVVGQGQALGVCRGFDPVFLTFVSLLPWGEHFSCLHHEPSTTALCLSTGPEATWSTDHGMKHLKLFTKTNTSLHFKLSQGFGQRDRKVTVWHIQSLGIYIYIIQNPGDRRHNIRLERYVCIKVKSVYYGSKEEGVVWVRCPPSIVSGIWMLGPSCQGCLGRPCKSWFCWRKHVTGGRLWDFKDSHHF